MPLIQYGESPGEEDGRQPEDDQEAREDEADAAEEGARPGRGASMRKRWPVAWKRVPAGGSSPLCRPRTRQAPTSVGRRRTACGEARCAPAALRSPSRLSGTTPARSSAAPPAVLLRRPARVLPPSRSSGLPASGRPVAQGRPHRRRRRHLVFHATNAVLASPNSGRLSGRPVCDLPHPIDESLDLSFGVVGMGRRPHRRRDASLFHVEARPWGTCHRDIDADGGKDPLALIPPRGQAR